MCGILGVVSTRAPVDEAAFESGLEAMQHRGPDGSGVWMRFGLEGPRVMLGHRRLAIIDLSDAAAQPMASDDGRAVLTFNGEIYNYRELMTELSGLGWRFGSQSDTEVLLAAYRQWGGECLSRLNGMLRSRSGMRSGRSCSRHGTGSARSRFILCAMMRGGVCVFIGDEGAVRSGAGGGRVE